VSQNALDKPDLLLSVFIVFLFSPAVLSTYFFVSDSLSSVDFHHHYIRPHLFYSAVVTVHSEWNM
jgi:hypothetical protein